MSEMVDRVAKAIVANKFASLDEWEWEKQSESFREAFRGEARAAIAAMADITPEMSHAFYVAGLAKPVFVDTHGLERMQLAGFLPRTSYLAMAVFVEAAINPRQYDMDCPPEALAKWYEDPEVRRIDWLLGGSGK